MFLTLRLQRKSVSLWLIFLIAFLSIIFPSSDFSHVLILGECFFEVSKLLSLYLFILVAMVLLLHSHSTSRRRCSVANGCAVGRVRLAHLRLPRYRSNYFQIRLLLLDKLLLIIEQLPLEAWVRIDHTSLALYVRQRLEHVVTVLLHEISDHTGRTS